MSRKGSFAQGELSHLDPVFWVLLAVCQLIFCALIVRSLQRVRPFIVDRVGLAALRCALSLQV